MKKGTELRRWLSEWDAALLLADSPATMQVHEERRRDTVRYLGEPPPTVLPLLWGWGCWLQEPAVSEQRLTPSMVNLRITGLCHSPGQSELLRWLSEWDAALLLADSPATMQVQEEERRRDTVRYLGEPPPTVLPLLWGWGCWLQEPAVSEQRLTPSMVNLRITGLCHSPGQSVQ